MPQVKLYATDVSPLTDEALFASVYGMISEERREKIDRPRFLASKCLSLGVEWLLVQACRDFGVDYSKQHFVIGENGKPAFSGTDSLHFNLSHSDQRAFCIASTQPVGCDVEKIRHMDHGIAKRFFAPAENDALALCQTDDHWDALFFRIWTLKEAFMKCTALGFGLPLNAFTILPTNDKITLNQQVDNNDYQLFTHTSNDGYQYAWCIKNTQEESLTEIPGIQWLMLK